MPTNYKDTRDCVRKKVKEMCFAGLSISAEEVGAKKINDLNLEQDTRMPGPSPYDGLAAILKSCSDVDIPNLTGNKLEQNQEWSVDDIAQFIYMETKTIKGEDI